MLSSLRWLQLSDFNIDHTSKVKVAKDTKTYGHPKYSKLLFINQIIIFQYLIQVTV